MRSLLHHSFFALRLVAALLVLWGGAAAQAENATDAAPGALTLYMVEQRGCVYCARWDAEVGDAYHLTEEGRTAPLRRIDLHDDPPEGTAFARPAQFTPTFILVRDGRELGRIEGYPGEDFFWGLLGQMLAEANS